MGLGKYNSVGFYGSERNTNLHKLNLLWIRLICSRGRASKITTRPKKISLIWIQKDQNRSVFPRLYPKIKNGDSARSLAKIYPSGATALLALSAKSNPSFNLGSTSMEDIKSLTAWWVIFIPSNYKTHNKNSTGKLSKPRAISQELGPNTHSSEVSPKSILLEVSLRACSHPIKYFPSIQPITPGNSSNLKAPPSLTLTHSDAPSLKMVAKKRSLLFVAMMMKRQSFWIQFMSITSQRIKSPSCSKEPKNQKTMCRCLDADVLPRTMEKMFMCSVERMPKIDWMTSGVSVSPTTSIRNWLQPAIFLLRETGIP